MEPKWKQCESMLARMAKSMGCTLKAVPGNCLIRAHWYIARGSAPLTVEYYSPPELLDRVLNYYEAFFFIASGRQAASNPFYGMSPEEAELRLAVMGA